jgi:anti-sigma regulatory factor (Ser/Thr protein kinase)
MRINVTVNIQDNNLLYGLQEVLKIIDLINKSEDSEDVICFQQKTFVTPLFILPLLVYVNGCSKHIVFVNRSSYMDTIHFNQGGLKPDTIEPSDFITVLNNFTYKTFLPIINFPAGIQKNNERNVILTAVENILIKQLGLKSNITAGIKYIIEESVDNIIEHSESERGYIFCQSYPTKKYLDICIADNGITLLGSYQKAANNDIVDHLLAIEAANSGISTKNLPDAENRGYGIATSKKMLVNGLSGNYVMLSGNALYLKTQTIDKFLSLPGSASWKGTIIAIRIPYINESFNYIQYIE